MPILIPTAAEGCSDYGSSIVRAQQTADAALDIASEDIVITRSLVTLALPTPLVLPNFATSPSTVGLVNANQPLNLANIITNAVPTTVTHLLDVNWHPLATIALKTSFATVATAIQMANVHVCQLATLVQPIRNVVHILAIQSANVQRMEYLALFQASSMRIVALDIANLAGFVAAHPMVLTAPLLMSPVAQHAMARCALA